MTATGGGGVNSLNVFEKLRTFQNSTELAIVEVSRPFKRCELVAGGWQRQGSSPSTHSLLVEVKHKQGEDDQKDISII